VSHLEFTLRIVVAFLAGVLIGLERQWRQQRAGLRTNALVSTGAAAFVAVSSMMPGDSSPTRIASQVVSGIGFLGAGVILREGLNVRGLNTAATLWCSAAAGTLAGLGFFVPSIITTAMVVAANIILRPLGKRMNAHKGSARDLPVCYRLQATCLERDEEHIRSLLMQCLSGDNILVKALRSELIEGSAKVHVQAEVITSGRHDRNMEQVIKRLTAEPGITALSWEVLGEEELVCNLE
jgi:putative Mg2+ transporter-C (MgtC) family protein